MVHRTVVAANSAVAAALGATTTSAGAARRQSAHGSRWLTYMFAAFSLLLLLQLVAWRTHVKHNEKGITPVSSGMVRPPQRTRLRRPPLRSSAAKSVDSRDDGDDGQPVATITSRRVPVTSGVPSPTPSQPFFVPLRLRLADKYCIGPRDLNPPRLERHRPAAASADRWNEQPTPTAVSSAAVVVSNPFRVSSVPYMKRVGPSFDLKASSTGSSSGMSMFLEGARELESQLDDGLMGRLPPGWYCLYVRSESKKCVAWSIPIVTLAKERLGTEVGVAPFLVPPVAGVSLGSVVSLAGAVAEAQPQSLESSSCCWFVSSTFNAGDRVLDRAFWITQGASLATVISELRQRLPSGGLRLSSADAAAQWGDVATAVSNRHARLSWWSTPLVPEGGLGFVGFEATRQDALVGGVDKAPPAEAEPSPDTRRVFVRGPRYIKIAQVVHVDGDDTSSTNAAPKPQVVDASRRQRHDIRLMHGRGVAFVRPMSRSTPEAGMAAHRRATGSDDASDPWLKYYRGQLMRDEITSPARTVMFTPVVVDDVVDSTKGGGDRALLKNDVPIIAVQSVSWRDYVLVHDETELVAALTTSAGLHRQGGKRLIRVSRSFNILGHVTMDVTQAAGCPADAAMTSAPDPSTPSGEGPSAAPHWKGCAVVIAFDVDVMLRVEGSLTLRGGHVAALGEPSSRSGLVSDGWASGSPSIFMTASGLIASHRHQVEDDDASGAAGHQAGDAKTERPSVLTRASQKPKAAAIGRGEWGGLLVLGGGKLVLEGCVISRTGSGREPRLKGSGTHIKGANPAITAAPGSDVQLTAVAMLNLRGPGLGLAAGSKTALHSCMMDDVPQGGECVGCRVDIAASHIVNVPRRVSAPSDFIDADNDGFYFRSGHATLRDVVIDNAADDGVDSASLKNEGAKESVLEIATSSISRAQHEAVALSSSSGSRRRVTISDSMFWLNQQGVELGHTAEGHTATVTRSVFRANMVAVRHGDNYPTLASDGTLQVDNCDFFDNGFDVLRFELAGPTAAVANDPQGGMDETDRSREMIDPVEQFWPHPDPHHPGGLYDIPQGFQKRPRMAIARSRFHRDTDGGPPRPVDDRRRGMAALNKGEGDPPQHDELPNLNPSGTSPTGAAVGRALAPPRFVDRSALFRDARPSGSTPFRPFDQADVAGKEWTTVRLASTSLAKVPPVMPRKRLYPNRGISLDETSFDVLTGVQCGEWHFESIDNTVVSIMTAKGESEGVGGPAPGDAWL